jgi:hypothetical protein
VDGVDGVAGVASAQDIFRFAMYHNLIG